MENKVDPVTEDVTKRIIGCAFAVSRSLGHGFLESVYRNALSLELIAEGLAVADEKPYPVHYRGERVGIYVADIVVNDHVIVELKVAEALTAAHKSQLVNYLKASHLSVGLLMNFGKPRVEIRRVIL